LKAVVVDQSLEIAGVKHLAADVVEPDALPEGLEGGKRCRRNGRHEGVSR